MAAPPYILCLETSTIFCSVALTNHRSCTSLVECCLPYVHLRLLPRLCEQVLRNADVSKSALSAIAISEGPGSFTALRIGTATAKGLCYALGLPLVACPTLQLLAAAAAAGLPERCLLLPLLPQKGETYAYALYDRNLDEQLSPRMDRFEASAVAKASATADAIYVLGEGEKAVAALREQLPTTVRLLTLPLRPSAAHMAAYTSDAFLKSKFTSLAAFVPQYADKKWSIAT